ncbi:MULTISPECIES: pyridoxamine 5'-phosphate oxidase family protein [unclassified Streptomyces]|uniref:pyridoxamine 5'-phosphate oxidase family protein n=1 Tax=unclassified Streptomyces TaxID=2593676 RepID=UPI001BE5B107|nr:MULTISPECIES: pyridoxamine 5'-phosphate oxidase family protein [unclassified Streptomyces]MBT2407799.1 pyridoxamine 5'-phosphate oxidase family protein [Streptomyces sp. ISL-21]MBT2456730.1 pyridoxamine 5'-phosphate oxidase family protein [Streptomyces sp. ISL-86]MBT2608511.1 pyridoxamine 5'-phosphate oxidase family protein [Streptomyces sp. ISL-87]
MTDDEPHAELDERYSDRGATSVPWQEAVALLTGAELYWLTTVRPDGRPHVTPLIGVWADGALHFCTGGEERKAKNLRTNPAVVATTGCNTLRDGYDVVVEGDAVRVEDEPRLRALARAWEAKYGAEWHFDVQDGAFVNPEAGQALVFAVAPRTAFGFGKGGSYSQTRWRF